VGKMTRTQSTLLLAFLILTWGANWPLTKYALHFIPPILFSGLRTLLGGLALLAVALPRYKELRLRSTLPIYAISAVVNVMCYYGFQTVGLAYLPSGLFSAIVFLQPVLVGVFAWMWLGESMSRSKLSGLLLGFFGVGVICTGAGGLAGHISWEGIALALASALTWALGTIYVKKVSPRVDPIWLVTMQLLIGGSAMTGAGSAFESWSDIVWTPSFVAALLFIAILVIAAGWIVFYKLMDSGEAGKVASFTFLIPLSAIGMGAMFLNEPLTPTLLAGLLLIVSGIFLVNRKPRRRAVGEAAANAALKG